MDDICFAVKDENGFYWCGLNKWEDQLRKAQLFHSWKWAVEVRDKKCGARSTKIVKVRITEECDYNPDWEI